MAPKHAMIFILILASLPSTQQFITDRSFVKFCENTKGILVATITGHTCEMKWNFPAANELEAHEYCETWGAYPLLSFKLEVDRAVCKYENVYECRQEYTLIRGHCLRLITPETLVYHGEGREICRKESDAKSGQIDLVQFWDDEDQIRFIEAYFSDLRGFWLRRRGIEDKNRHFLVYFMGLAISFDTIPGEVFEIDPSLRRRAQIMCSYQAKETPLSFRYMMKKLQPYYFQTVTVDFMSVWRTSSHYSALASKNSSEPVEMCIKSMAPISNGAEVSFFDPTVANLQNFDEKMRASYVKAYSPMFHCYWDNDFWIENEQNFIHEKMYKIVTKPMLFKNLKCQHWPFVEKPRYNISTINSNTNDYKTFSIIGGQTVERNLMDFSPLFCQLIYTDSTKKTRCSGDWIAYTRKNGNVVCHKRIDIPSPFDVSRQHCQAMRGDLSTFGDQGEYDLLLTFKEVIIGLRKNAGCETYDKGCAPEKIASWPTDNRFGDNSPESLRFVNSKWWKNEPNHDRGSDWCITLSVYGTIGLNDLRCNLHLYYSCMRDADLL